MIVGRRPGTVQRRRRGGAGQWLGGRGGRGWAVQPGNDQYYSYAPSSHENMEDESRIEYSTRKSDAISIIFYSIFF